MDLPSVVAQDIAIAVLKALNRFGRLVTHASAEPAPRVARLLELSDLILHCHARTQVDERNHSVHHAVVAETCRNVVQTADKQPVRRRHADAHVWTRTADVEHARAARIATTHESALAVSADGADTARGKRRKRQRQHELNVGSRQSRGSLVVWQRLGNALFERWTLLHAGDSHWLRLADVRVHEVVSGAGHSGGASLVDQRAVGRHRQIPLCLTANAAAPCVQDVAMHGGENGVVHAVSILSDERQIRQWIRLETSETDEI